MIELLGVAATAAVTILGFVQARRFVSDRLRFVDAVQSPLAPFIAGAAAPNRSAVPVPIPRSPRGARLSLAGAASRSAATRAGGKWRDTTSGGDGSA
jgi:hypothetical protein